MDKRALQHKQTTSERERGWLWVQHPLRLRHARTVSANFAKGSGLGLGFGVFCPYLWFAASADCLYVCVGYIKTAIVRRWTKPVFDLAQQKPIQTPEPASPSTWHSLWIARARRKPDRLEKQETSRVRAKLYNNHWLILLLLWGFFQLVMNTTFSPVFKKIYIYI